MSNDDPPRACLVDFGPMMMVFDPGQPICRSTQLEGVMVMFISPELLVPSKFGVTELIPTSEADIYAFGLFIQSSAMYVTMIVGTPFTYTFQVLASKLLFSGPGIAEIVLNVVQGVRPAEQENALAIGLSDPLRDFVQCYWDGEMKL